MIYEEDHFHPLVTNELDDQYNNKNILNDIKSLDKGYHKVKRNLNKICIDGKYHKNIFIEFYVSGDTGNKIRNAITGYRSCYKVGSVDEHIFFKVKMVNGECRKGTGYGSLFYDSPEQFEKHQFSILKQEVKDEWYKKQKNNYIPIEF
jgi:hypothetical protein